VSQRKRLITPLGFLSHTCLHSKNLCIKLHCAFTNNTNNLRYNYTAPLPDCIYLRESQIFSTCCTQHMKPNCFDSLQMAPCTAIILGGMSHAVRHRHVRFGSACKKLFSKSLRYTLMRSSDDTECFQVVVLLARTPTPSTFSSSGHQCWKYFATDLLLPKNKPLPFPPGTKN
jgi:hypothetical protein